MTGNAHATITDFLDRTAAKAAAPGGGAAAALVGASGAALAAMALRYSIAKAPALERSLAIVIASRAALEQLMDEDCVAYAAVAAAYALSRATEAQIQARAAAIRRACRVAMTAPLGGMVAATDALTALHDALPHTNKNLHTDAATAAVALSAAVDGLGFFVLVNANELGDDPDAHDARREEARLRDLATRASHEIRTTVRSALEERAQ